MRHDVAGLVDVKILRAPAMDVVKRARRVNAPRRLETKKSAGTIFIPADDADKRFYFFAAACGAGTGCFPA
jgi:hypothetical protein